jgi:hypothetical protein
VDPEEIVEDAPEDGGTETRPRAERRRGGTESVETPADPYADFGGRESVEQAMALHKATQSQDGLMRLFFEAGRSQGLSYSQMEALFGQAAPEPAAAQYADDDLLTYAQVKELMQREVLEPMHQSQAQQAEANARARSSPRSATPWASRTTPPGTRCSSLVTATWATT